MAAEELEPQWRIPPGRGRELGIGIVGCGGIVRIGHLPAYRAAGLRVVAVQDVDQERALEVARDFVIPHVAASAAELIERDDVEIVDVAAERRSVRIDEVVGATDAAAGVAAG